MKLHAAELARISPCCLSMLPGAGCDVLIVEDDRQVAEASPFGRFPCPTGQRDTLRDGRDRTSNRLTGDRLLHGGLGLDFLVTKCPRRLKYVIEGVVEDCFGGLPFHVVYLGEFPVHKLDRFAKEAGDTRHLR